MKIPIIGTAVMKNPHWVERLYKSIDYPVDNFVIFRDRDGNKQKFLIEIKPSKQVAKPVASNRKKQSTTLYEQTTWITNQAKWEAAKKWADKKNCQFIILTEKELGIR